MNQSDYITRRLIELREDRDRERARKLATGELVIGLDRNGKPITLPARKEQA